MSDGRDPNRDVWDVMRQTGTYFSHVEMSGRGSFNRADGTVTLLREGGSHRGPERCRDSSADQVFWSWVPCQLGSFLDPRNSYMLSWGEFIQSFYFCRGLALLLITKKKPPKKPDEQKLNLTLHNVLLRTGVYMKNESHKRKIRRKDVITSDQKGADRPPAEVLLVKLNPTKDRNKRDSFHLYQWTYLSVGSDGYPVSRLLDYLYACKQHIVKCFNSS